MAYRGQRPEVAGTEQQGSITSGGCLHGEPKTAAVCPGRAAPALPAPPGHIPGEPGLRTTARPHLVSPPCVAVLVSRRTSAEAASAERLLPTGIRRPRASPMAIVVVLTARRDGLQRPGESDSRHTATYLGLTQARKESLCTAREKGYLGGVACQLSDAIRDSPRETARRGLG